MDEFERSHRRFFVSPSQISEAKVRIDGPDARQITTVLRLRAGDPINVLDGLGTEYTTRITSATKASVTAEIIRKDHPDTEPGIYVTLAQALPKGCKLELIVQKACELGISEVIGLVTERSICRPVKEKLVEKTERWQRIAKEACEQCARVTVPTVRGAAGLDELLQEIPNYDLVIVAHEDEKKALLSTVLDENKHARRVLIVIGPEGGLTEREVEMLVKAGARPVSLGRRVLRAETAAIAACVITLDRLDGHL